MNARLQTFKDEYPGMQIDMLLLEGREHFGQAHLSFQGCQYYDITMITRVRNCLIGVEQCFTLMMDDYRYESGKLTSDAIGWYTIVAFVRVIGQTCAWIHVSIVFVGCYSARHAESQFKSARLLVIVQAALHSMFTCPSQVAIYTSIFTVACYTVAHLIDGNMVYELVAEHFITILGVFELDIRKFVRIATISTQSVSVISLVFHAVLLVRVSFAVGIRHREFLVFQSFRRVPLLY